VIIQVQFFIDVREKAATIHVYNKGEDARQTLTG